MALCTAAEVRAYMPDLSGSAEDTALDVFIARIGQTFAEWCGYPAASVGGTPTIESATYTRYYDPARAVRLQGGIQYLDLGIHPVTSVTSVHDDPDLAYSSTYEIVSGDRGLDGAAGRIYLLPTSSKTFSATGSRAIKAVYVAGYATVPVGLKHAACLAVRDAYASRNTPQPSGIAGSSRGPWTAEVASLLQPYRLPAALGVGYQGEA